MTIFLACLALAYPGHSAHLDDKAPLVADHVYDVPSSGSFDYMAFDAKYNRVFASHGGAQTLTVLDLNDGQVTELPTGGVVNGVQIDPKLGLVFAGGHGKTLLSFDEKTLAPVGKAALDGSGDDICLDPVRQRIYVCEDDGTHDWVFDAKTLAPIGTVNILEGPEYLEYDSATDSLYQNIAKSNQLQRIDPKTLSIADTWATPGETSPHGMAIDAKYHLVLSAGKNSIVCAYDDKSGKQIGTARIAPNVDQITYDAGLHRIYSACRGKISITQVTRNGLKDLGDVDAPTAAHTITVDTKTHTVYVCYGGAQGENAHIQAFVVPMSGN